MVAGYDLWPKSNQITEYLAEARIQEKLLLMEYLREGIMLKHNINAKILYGLRAEEKRSLVLSPAPNLCVVPVLTVFMALAFLGLPSLSVHTNPRVHRC